MTGTKGHSLTLLAAIAAVLSAAPASAVSSVHPEIRWVASWASAQILVDPHDALSVTTRADVTLRQLVRTSVGGARLRIRVSNAFGQAPLSIAGMTIARALSPGSSRVDPSTIHNVAFAGARDVIVPAGADYVSDAVDMRVPAFATLAVSIHFPEAPKLQTGHPGSRATSYVSQGDQLSATDLEGATALDHWYFLSEIDVEPSGPSGAIAVLGDSITDGHGVVTNTNGRWTDVLAERLARSPLTRSLSVLNDGIGGNRLVDDGIGPNAAARFERDVIARNGVQYLIIFEGVNDLGVLTRDAPVSAAGHETLVRRMLTAYAQMIGRAHEHRIRVIGATIMPYGASGYYHPGAANEADRQAINAWIRNARHFDAVIDFDMLMRDPNRPSYLRKEYDSGDGLHPSIDGYRAMGEAVPLSLFTGVRR